MASLNQEKMTIESALNEARKSLEEKDSQVEELRRIIEQNKFKQAYSKFKMVGFRALGVFSILGVFFLLFFTYTDEPWNFVSQFINHVESLSEMRKEVVKWGLVVILTLGESICGKTIWNHLLKAKRIEYFKKNIEKYS